ncbi:MAG: peptide deformylase [Blautia sp.]|nr:peptide deformylase [Blautia sp.]
MALRTIRTEGDPVLEKICKPVKDITPRISQLIDDMLETMHDAGGVGLAAPQVGVLRRIAVIDVSEDGTDPVVLINPEIIEQSGEQTGDEGCLSVPGVAGKVTRPETVKVRTFDKDLNEVILDAEGLKARAFCHEIDHLDGKLYTRLVEGELHEVSYEDDEEEE